MNNLGNVNRQYVGARYVPKFYDNNGSSEWVSGVPYEPLTVVTYLGNSYTSKIPVPSNAGAPSVAVKYWVNTGNFNAQVEKLSNTVSKNSELLGFINNVCTPQMFGGSGDANYFFNGAWYVDSEHTVLSTDNTESINKCIAECYNTGKIVLIPEGNYLIGSSINVPYSGITIIGSATFKSNLVTNSIFNGVAMLNVSSGSSNNATQNFNISNIRFTPKASVRGISCGYLIYNTSFKNLLFHNFDASAIYFSGEYKDASEEIVFENIQIHTLNKKLREPLFNATLLHESLISNVFLFGGLNYEFEQEHSLMYLENCKGLNIVSCGFFYQRGEPCIHVFNNNGIFIDGCTFENNECENTILLDGDNINSATFARIGFNRRNIGSYKCKLNYQSEFFILDPFFNVDVSNTCKNGTIFTREGVSRTINNKGDCNVISFWGSGGFSGLKLPSAGGNGISFRNYINNCFMHMKTDSGSSDVKLTCFGTSEETTQLRFVFDDNISCYINANGLSNPTRDVLPEASFAYNNQICVVDGVAYICTVSKIGVWSWKQITNV